MHLEKRVEISDKQLLEAISLRFCRHFPALNIANGLGGLRTIPWDIVHTFKPAEMLEEAESRNLDLTELEAAMSSCDCCPRLVIDSSLFEKVATKKPVG